MVGWAGWRAGVARPDSGPTGERVFARPSGRGVCGQARNLDYQEEARVARTSRHRSAGETVHGESSSDGEAVEDGFILGNCSPG
jgi:hypothetical protein